MKSAKCMQNSMLKLENGRGFACRKLAESLTKNVGSGQSSCAKSKDSWSAVYVKYKHTSAYIAYSDCDTSCLVSLAFQNSLAKVFEISTVKHLELLFSTSSARGRFSITRF